MEQIQVLKMLAANLQDCTNQCGLKLENVYDRGSASVLDYISDRNRARFVFNDDRIHLLFGEKDINLSDDSQFTLDTTYLFVLAEYDEKDVKSLANEVTEYLTDIYVTKKTTEKKAKNVQTVSKAAAKSGALSYDPQTLAARLEGMFPETKNKARDNIEANGEFFCEEYFTTVMNPYIKAVIENNNPKEMKKLFNILGEVYEDGTNEVQSLIAVTILGEIDYLTLMNNVMPYLTDTMLEPVTTVNKQLSKSRSARMRLENPPKYKPPKKKKSGGFMSSLMGGGSPASGIQS